MTAALKNRRFLVFGGAAALCAVFLLVSVLVQASRYRKLNADHSSVTSQLAELSAGVEGVDVEQLREENRSLAADLEEIERSLPEREYIPTLLDEISSLARETGNDVEEVRRGAMTIGLTALAPGQVVEEVPEGEEAGEGAGQQYSALEIEVRLIGSYHGTYKFIKRLGNMGKILSVETVDITKMGGETTAPDGGVEATVRLEVKAFILPPRSGFPGELTMKVY